MTHDIEYGVFLKQINLNFKLFLLGFKSYIKCVRVEIITITHALEHKE